MQPPRLLCALGEPIISPVALQFLFLGMATALMGTDGKRSAPLKCNKYFILTADIV